MTNPLDNYLRAINAHSSALHQLRQTRLDFQRSEHLLQRSTRQTKAMQVVGHQVAEVLKRLNDDKYIVKSTSGPRYVVGIKKKAKEDAERLISGLGIELEEKDSSDDATNYDGVFKRNKKKNNANKNDKNTNDKNTNNLVDANKKNIFSVLESARMHKQPIVQRFGFLLENRIAIEAASKIKTDNALIGQRVALDITTLTIMRFLPPEVDPRVYQMIQREPATVNYNQIGGLAEQIRDLREVVELPLKNPEIYKRVGISHPKGVLLYGPPGTGKTLLCRALASSLDVCFLKIVASAIVGKYIGESARMVREIFAFARQAQPCIVFIDEIDAIGGKRSSESNSSDREVQRTMMELLAQMDGFTELEQIKIIMATNRPDILDKALLRPGRIDRRIEIGLPNETARKEILKIHAHRMKSVDLSDDMFDLLVDLSVGFNGADLRNVCTEAGLLAIRDERDFSVRDDFVKAVRKIADVKKLESRMEYKKR